MKTNKVTFIVGIVLLGAAFIASCSKDDPAVVVDKSALTTAIASANTLLTTTFEGVGTGNYQRGSKSALSNSVTVAQVIADLPEASKASVLGAVSNLNAAIALYGTKIVTPIDPTNLVGQWTFDQLTSTAAGTVVKDYSGNNRDGAIKVGNANLLPAGGGVAALGTDRYGVSGKALLLDKGANVEIPYNTAFNQPAMSFSVWVKLKEKRNNRFIGMQSWLGYKFEVQDGNVPFLSVGHSGGTYDRDAGIAIGLDAWYHLVTTYKAGEMKFYVNGILVKTWTDTPNAAKAITPTFNLVLGCDFPSDKYSSDPNGTNFDVVGNADYHIIPAAWGGYLHGYLDEVRIYKTVLTEAQVTSIYDLEKP
jgi:hypothetical protein